MTKLALFLLLVFPSTLAVASTASIQSRTSLKDRPIRISLLNMSSQERQMVLVSGERVDLPFGVRVDVNSRIGATIVIVSNTHSSVDERILIKSGDDAGMLRIH